MAGELTILSAEWDDPEKLLTDLLVSAHRAKFYAFYKHESDGKVQMVNYYGHNEERLIWDVFSKVRFETYLQKYSHLEPEENNHFLKFLPDGMKLYRIAMSDDSHDDHIIYDFAKEYLAINPTKLLLEESTETLITLDYIKLLESKGGYYKDWCYQSIV